MQDKYGFQAAAEQPAFQQTMRMLAEVFGKEPKPWKRQKGVYGWKVGLKTLMALQDRYALDITFARAVAKSRGREERLRLLLDRLQEEVRELEAFLLLARLWGDEDGVPLLLFPTNDQYTVLRARGTNGDNYGLRPKDVADWLREMAKEHPWMLTAAAIDFLEGRFLQPLSKATARPLAEKMYEFCPDLVDQGCGSVSALATELVQSQRLFLWWD
jgi:hypothetical protein